MHRTFRSKLQPLPIFGCQAEAATYAARLSATYARLFKVLTAAELELVRERAELDRALRALRPEDLAAVSRVNHALAESIQSLLPRLESGKKASEGGAPYRAHSAPSSERWTGGSYP